ncbi:MAG: ASKHA domain-containing protein [Anaerolineae bacterium]
MTTPGRNGAVTHYEVDLEPIGRRVEVEPGKTVLEAAQAAGIELVSICGGIGSCGECVVRLAEGRLSPPTLTEEAELGAAALAAGHRLACQAAVVGAARIEIPPTSLTTPQRLQIEGQAERVELEPTVVAVPLRIPPPTLADLRSDVSRLQAALADAGCPDASLAFPVLADLSDLLRAQGWQATAAVRGGEVIALLPPDTPLLGLAVDVGTTKLAAYLVSLATGETLAKSGAMNPQIAYGEDVVSRIAYCNDHPQGRHTLQKRLVDTLNGMVAALCAAAGATAGQVVDAVIVGNTAMHHLLAGLPVRQLGAAPYVAAVTDALAFPARDIGLALAPGARVFLPPNIAGYVGADHVAMLLATHEGVETAPSAPRTVIALDIGTNTEISLFHGERLLSCSCASGPAFEGAHIHDGMRAAPGAIERVRIEGDEVQTFTIEGAPPVGVCGSGILDAVAEMLAAGALDRRGVLATGHPRVRREHGRAEFVLADASATGHGRDIVVTRKDVNEIQLAKGAIRAGVEVLLAEAGLTDGDVDKFIVAGAFGTYLDLRSAVRIGMFPDLPLARFAQVGNAAGAGARQMLLSGRLRQRAAEYERTAEYIELTTHPAFTDRYVEALAFDTVTPS